MKEIILRISKLKEVILNTGWLLFEKMFNMGVSFIVALWMARYLGPEQFGILNYSLAFVAIIGAFVPMGLIGFVVKELIENPSKKNEILGTAFYIRLASGLLGLLFSIIIALIINVNDTETLIIISIISVGHILQAFDIMHLHFESKVESKFSVYSRSSAFIVCSLTKIVLIIFEAPLAGFAIVYLAETLLTVIILFFFYQNKSGGKFSEWTFSYERMKKLLRVTWPLIISSMAAVIYLKVDQIMLSHMINEKEVGIYSAAVKLSEVWYFFPVVIVSSFFPKLVKLKNENRVAYNRKLQNLYDFLFIIAFFAAAFISISAKPIILATYGDQYIEASSILIIHVWGAIFVFLRALLSKWLIAENLLIFSTISHGLGVLINILMNLWMIPIYGGVGASIATVLSYSVSAFLFTLLSSKTRGEGKKMALSMIFPLRFALITFRKKVIKLDRNSKKNNAY